MPLSKRDPANLWDMLQAAEKIQLYLKHKTLEDFLRDKILYSLPEYPVKIMVGEAHPTNT
jgi:uncharacterized protein with HEPN domain